jgi:hypothetical protein
MIAWAVVVEGGGYGSRAAAPMAGNLVVKAQSLKLLAQPQPLVESGKAGERAKGRAGERANGRVGERAN